MEVPPGATSYSQFGEDLLINQLLPEKTGFYVDVGAHDPWRYSNTALLHLKGWRGINIDADPRAVARLKLARPADLSLQIGVSDISGDLDFLMFSDGAINSFDREIAEGQSTHRGQFETIKVKVERLSTILERYLPAGLQIDYLNIDCEGSDEFVLRGSDWSKFRPRVISVEIPNFNLQAATESGSYILLRDAGYLLRAHYFATAIFHRLDVI